MRKQPAHAPFRRHSDITWQHVECIDSTNQYLLTHDIAMPYVLSTDFQTAGRGRRGKQWQNPDNALMFSTAFELPSVHENLSLWQLVVAITMADTLSSLTAQTIYIKWPNDIYASIPTSPPKKSSSENNMVVAPMMGKMAGILVENQIGIRRKIVTGIGINLCGLDLDGAKYQSSYLAVDGDKQDLLTVLANALYQAWQDFCHNQVIDLSLFTKYDYLQDKNIRAIDGETQRMVEGRCLGITDQGHLRVLINGALHTLSTLQQIELVTYDTDNHASHADSFPYKSETGE